jgi:phosphatidylglycerol:prolipoprotein diacylglycerol transferase
MRRILFWWLGHPVYSYPAMLYVGIVLGIYAQLYAAISVGLDPASILSATLLLLIFALFGARLLHLLPNWRLYRQHPRRILQFSNGGASMYGGLLLAVPLSFPLLAALDIPFWTYWDLASFTMLVGMIVTRAGCFLNGCCAGRPTSAWWGMHLPDYRGIWQRRVPSQILEAVWGTVVLVGALLLWKRAPFDGVVFLCAVGTYGAGRIVLESLRDRPDRIGGISVHKALSIGFVTISLCAVAALLVHGGSR